MSDKISFIARFILFAGVHSLFAAVWVKKALHGSDRPGYRLCYNCASLVLLGWVMSAYGHSDVLYVAPGVTSLIMYALQLGIIGILASCLRQTGIGEFLGFTRRTSTSFTSTGLYSMVRHPLYFFSILFMVMNPVVTAQWLILTIMGTVYFIIGALIEEKRFTAEYGDAYRRYQQNVPFIIPTLSRRVPRNTQYPG